LYVFFILVFVHLHGCYGLIVTEINLMMMKKLSFRATVSW